MRRLVWLIILLFAEVQAVNAKSTEGKPGSELITYRKAK